MTISIHEIDDPCAFMDELMRRSFPAFLRKAAPLVMGGSPLDWNWHLDAIACRLERLEQGKELRLLVTLPPRNLKSITISVAWVAWRLGKNPELNFLCVSYSNELGAKLARQCLALMRSQWYRKLFPGTVIAHNRTATHDFDTSRGGGRFTTSITGTMTGRGGDIIIVDDPIKPEDAESETVRESVNHWYRSTLTSRLNDKRTGAIIAVMQRLHAFDLAGQMIEDGGWDHLCLAAIAEEDETIPLTRRRSYHRKASEALHTARESVETLEIIKRAQGSRLFNSQYQQNPVPPGGNIIKAKWLQEYDLRSIDEMHGQIVMSCDTAIKDGKDNDYTAIITALVTRKLIYIIDVFRGRVTFPKLKTKVADLVQAHGADVLLVEDAASGPDLIHEIYAAANWRGPVPISRRPAGDKQTRVHGVSAMIESGRLFLPSDAHWLADYTTELLGFPNARYDDQVDATSQLLEWVRERDMEPLSIIAGPIEMPLYGDDSTDDSGIWPDGKDPWSGL